MKLFAVVGLAAMLFLTGCSSPSAPRSDAPKSAKPQSTYSTVVDLRDAFKKAGGDCPSWDQADRVTLAAQSGDCSGSTVLSIYTSSDSRDQIVTYAKNNPPAHLLVGENWIINTPDPEQFAKKLGGVVVTK